MAGSSVIGALRVNLGIESAAFSSGLKGAEGSLQRFAASAAKVGATIAAGLTLAIGGVAVAVKGMINEADRLNKMAQSIGVPVEELSKLKYAADLSDVSLEDLGTTIGKLSKGMADVANGAKGPVAKAFASLGISVKNSDGSLRSSSEVMIDVADRFVKMKDGAAKTALAMQLFGKTGATLIPLLNAGGAGLRQMTDEATKLGIVIDSKTAASAERFNDNLTRLGAVKDGIITKITAGMLPALERLSQIFVDVAIKSDLVKNVTSLLVGAMDGLSAAIHFVWQNMGTIIQAFKVFVAAQIVGFLASAVGGFLQLARMIKTTGLVLGAFTALSNLSVKGLVLIAGAIAIATGQFEKLEGAVSALWTRVQGLLPESLQHVGENLMAAFSLDQIDASATANFASLLQHSDDAATSFGGLGAAASRAKGSVTDLAKTGADAMQSMGQTISSSFSNAFDAAIEGTFNFQDALQGLVKDLAKLLINNAFQSLVGGLFGGGGFLGGLFGGGGLKFATGGSFNVPGVGGPDSKFVSFMATPGERVQVSRPGQMADGPAHVVISVKAGQMFEPTVERISGNVVVVSEKQKTRQQQLSQ